MEFIIQHFVCLFYFFYVFSLLFPIIRETFNTMKYLIWTRRLAPKIQFVTFIIQNLWENISEDIGNSFPSLPRLSCRRISWVYRILLNIFLWIIHVLELGLRYPRYSSLPWLYNLYFNILTCLPCQWTGDRNFISK